jgi:low temperature requirement protein LtrA
VYVFAVSQLSHLLIGNLTLADPPGLRVAVAPVRGGLRRAAGRTQPDRLAESEDPGRLARDAYSYLHLPIVAGIIMVAVGDDLLIGTRVSALAVGAAVAAILTALALWEAMPAARATSDHRASG